MEPSARLAVLENVIKGKFSLFLRSFQEIIDNVLINSDLEDYRRVNLTYLPYLHEIIFLPEVIKFLECSGFYIKNGFLIIKKEYSCDNLINLKDILKRKYLICNGGEPSTSKRLVPNECYKNVVSIRYTDTSPLRILNTSNPFLIQMEDQLNFMQCYEDPDVLQVARNVIPIESLKVKAIERMRFVQRKIKKENLTDEIELGMEEALVIELLEWFKHKFFSWVDSPPCHSCGNSTAHARTHVGKRRNEICRIEVFACTKCQMETEFCRFRDPLTLLSTRRGRCGEWASCFTLLLRALGYDTRFIADSNDHVWNEFYSNALRRWVHVDSCEKAFDTPLVYETGWGKKITYVLAYSWDDVQDVTWRYSANHAAVKTRRISCSESDLLAAILTLRNSRPLSPARRKYLAKRHLEEVCQLMVQPSANSGDCQGRTSGSLMWRVARNEVAVSTKRAFKLTPSGDNTFSYCASSDCAKWNETAVGRWSDMLYECKSIARKTENDWKMAYLARAEGCGSPGQMVWCFEAPKGSTIKSLRISAKVECYENAQLEWSITSDDGKPEILCLNNGHSELNLNAARLLLSVRMSGGRGDNAWQHAQLARQPLSDLSDGIRFTLSCS